MTWSEDGSAEKAQHRLALLHQKGVAKERWWSCAACRTPVVPDRAQTTRDDRHRHSFFNPHGHHFILGCFSQAPGCLCTGEETKAWTWFEGFAWTIAVCRNCAQHLGWRYRHDNGTQFFGLILDRLAPPSDMESN